MQKGKRPRWQGIGGCGCQKACLCWIKSLLGQRLLELCLLNAGIIVSISKVFCSISIVFVTGSQGRGILPEEEQKEFNCRGVTGMVRVARKSHTGQNWWFWADSIKDVSYLIILLNDRLDKQNDHDTRPNACFALKQGKSDWSQGSLRAYFIHEQVGYIFAHIRPAITS